MRSVASKRVLYITETAVMTALLIVLQAATKPAGQYVTGTCVNAVLAVSVLAVGLWSGITVALLSPVFAFLLGIGPQLPPVTPSIMVGNLVFVLLLGLLAGERIFPVAEGRGMDRIGCGKICGTVPAGSEAAVRGAAPERGADRHVHSDIFLSPAGHGAGGRRHRAAADAPAETGAEKMNF